MTNKINHDSMKKQYEDLWTTFCKKNHDYGSSFEQSLDKHGLVAGIVRMEDKMNRIFTLVDVDKHAEIASESLADTLRDLSNYSAMAACWLDGPDDVYNEENLQKIENHLFGSVRTTMDKEEFKNMFHLASFEGHQEKVNELVYYNREDVSDEEIIKNWGLVGDSKTVRSRTTGQYLVEDDNPELFRKIFGVLRAHYRYESFKKMKDQLTGTDEEFEGRFNDLKETVFEQINRSREVVTTELKGLENGYFIRQHKNLHDSYRYTLAFNPGGTIKIQDDVEKPYVIECFSNDNDGVDSSNVWAIHVFDTREDMVAALNYDARVRRPFESRNFGKSINGLDVKVSVFVDFDVPKILDIWEDTFGEAFNNQMLSRNLDTEVSIEKYHGIKTFGPVFISEKTGALVVKGHISDRRYKRHHNFVWFSDTKEVLLEVMNAAPKFNSHGIFYDIYSEHLKTGENIHFNPLYNNMEDKILSKFQSWSVFEVESELKNLVFFNEDEPLNSEFTEKRMRIPGDLSGKKSGDTDGNEDFDRSFGHI